MIQNRWAFPGFIVWLLLAGLACVIPGVGSSAPPASPTPLGDSLSFLIPAYTISLAPGDFVPGTRLHYLGRQNGAYQVTIDGLSATKRIGDSFIWNGVMAPGVYANYNLRLTTAVFGALPVAGPVEIIVFNPEPVGLALTAAVISAQPYFANIFVDYRIPPGRTIPGTTLVYEGIVSQGEGQQTSQLAQLSGLTGYPYLALGDSLIWTGQLRDNVYIRYSLRAAAISENDLRLAGTAELWITSE